MPKRPRAHILESEARLAFRVLLQPTGWVVRDADNPDYGVDDLVEVFASDGDATGLQFYVQSKGTDKPLKSALSTVITTRQQNYFHELDLPVLVARYHSKSKRTFVKWFHQFDPYPLSASQVIHFNETNELTADNVADLESDLRAYRFWHNPHLEWPLEAEITSEIDVAARELGLSVYSLIGGTHIINFYSSNATSEPSHPCSRPLQILVSDDTIRVEASYASHTFHTQTSDLKHEDIAVLIAFSISDVLFSLGHPQQASFLLTHVLRARHLSHENTERAGIIFGACGSVEPVAEIGGFWLANAVRPTDLDPPIVLITSFIESARFITYEQRRALADVLRRLAEAALESNDQNLLGSAALLSAARIYFGVGDWQAADELFDAAVTRGRSLISRTDVLTEVAGAAHQAGDYPRAIELYTEAIKLHPQRTRLRLRRADSLMFAGQYSSARTEFETYFALESGSSTYEPLWHLKYFLVRNITDSGISDGKRSPAAALAELDKRQPGDTHEQADVRFRRAASLDALSVEVWAEIGQFEVDRNDRHRAAGPLIYAALLSRTPRTWAVAIANAVRERLTELAEMATAVALYDHGDDFHIALRGEVNLLDDGESIVDWVELHDADWGRRRRGDRS